MTKSAKTAWITLAAIIAAYELAAPDTQLLSEEVDRWIERRPLTTRIAILVVALHLVNWLPEKVDPVHLLAVQARKRRTKT